MVQEIRYNELDVSISQEEILKAISKLKNNKSPGLDNITNNMLKVVSKGFYLVFKNYLTLVLRVEIIQRFGPKGM
jgi:hypothetical protein